jgi:hypothetical protein
LIAGCVIAVTIAAACDSIDARTTARITRFHNGRACLLPEDRSQGYLIGCYPVSPSDAAKVKIGSCVSVVIPNQLEAKKRNEPLRSVKLLDRPCAR